MCDLTQTAFMEIELPSEEDAVFLGSRSVSIKGIFEPWGSGASVEECLDSAKVSCCRLQIILGVETFVQIQPQH